MVSSALFDHKGVTMWYQKKQNVTPLNNFIKKSKQPLTQLPTASENKPTQRTN